MKRRYGILLLFMIFNLFVLVGCGAAEKKSEQQYADKEFITTLQDALQKRWDAADSFKEDSSNKDKMKETYESYIDIEISALEPFKDKKFEDSKLQEKALKYINILNDSKEALSYMNVDFLKCMETYKKHNNERAKLISDFVNDYDLKVDAKYNSILEDFLTNAKDVNEKQERDKKVNTLVQSISFTPAKDTYGVKEYEAVVENNVGIDFDYFSLSINLLDANGVIIDTTYAGVENWGNGQKAKFTFITNKDFASTKIEGKYNQK